MKNLFHIFSRYFRFAAVLGIWMLAVSASASGPFVGVRFSTTSPEEGSVFIASSFVDPGGGKSCVVSGSFEILNGSCVGASLFEGLYAQKMPTCQDRRFVIGIPRCTGEEKELMNVSVAAGSPGKGSFSFSGIRIVGEGVLTGETGTGADYFVLPTPPASFLPTSSPPEVVAPFKVKQKPVVKPKPETSSSSRVFTRSAEQATGTALFDVITEGAQKEGSVSGSFGIILSVVAGIVLSVFVEYCIYHYRHYKKHEKKIS